MSKFNLHSKAIELELERKALMEELAKNARDFFVKTFDEEQWDKEKWAEAKDGHHPLLVRSGNLREALVNSIESVDSEGYTLNVDNPYGKYHNEGTDTLDKREFIGESEELNKQQEEIIKKHVNKILKK